MSTPLHCGSMLHCYVCGSTLRYVRFRSSDGRLHDVPKDLLDQARIIDPELLVISRTDCDPDRWEPNNDDHDFLCSLGISAD